jgi:hypothetical protein
MRTRFVQRSLPALAFGVISAASAVSSSGCARASFYDPVYLDTHRWDSREEATYRRWEAERQLQHVEFKNRHDDEQREFWRWRHDHPDR